MILSVAQTLADYKQVACRFCACSTKILPEATWRVWFQGRQQCQSAGFIYACCMLLCAALYVYIYLCVYVCRMSVCSFMYLLAYSVFVCAYLCLCLQHTMKGGRERERERERDRDRQLRRLAGGSSCKFLQT